MHEYLIEQKLIGLTALEEDYLQNKGEEDNFFNEEQSFGKVDADFLLFLQENNTQFQNWLNKIRSRRERITDALQDFEKELTRSRCFIEKIEER